MDIKIRYYEIPQQRTLRAKLENKVEMTPQELGYLIRRGELDEQDWEMYGNEESGSIALLD